MMWIIIYLLLWKRILADNITKCPAGTGRVNRTCKECPAGYFGRTCSVKCFGRAYGPFCALICNCSRTEECHHIYGCIPTTQIYEQTVTTDLPSRPAPDATTINYDFVEGQWFHYIYGLIIAGLFIVVLVLIVCLLVTHKRRIDININGRELHNVTKSAQINSTNGAYEYVDNNFMVGSTPNSSQRGEDINAVEFLESCSDTTQSLNDSGKPHYQTLLTNSYRDVHIYNNTENAVVFQNDDYLDPFPYTYTYDLRRPEGCAKEFFVEEEISLD